VSRAILALALIGALSAAAFTSGTTHRAGNRAKAPRLIQRPALSGVATQGRLQRTSVGRWSSRPSQLWIHWLRCDARARRCQAIARASGRRYLLTAADVSHRIRARVYVGNRFGSASAASAPTAVVRRAKAVLPKPPGNTSPIHIPAPAPAVAVTCSSTFSNLAAAVSAMQGAAQGATVCLTAGDYGRLSLSIARPGNVTLAAAPGAHVTVGAVNISGSHIALEGLWIRNEVDIQAGASFITLDHDDVTGGYFGVVFDTSDCTIPNAPTWSGCEPQPKITDVTISHDHFHDIGQASGGEDAIHLDNWARVRVTGNEFDHIVEGGNHTDCLQAVYGGTSLLFDHNYEHDNNCEGFFLKDGDATGVSFVDNLFVRDQIGRSEGFAQIWNSADTVVERNTIWDEKGIALVADGPAVAPAALVDHNVLCEASLNGSYAVTEGYDIFGDQYAKFPRNGATSRAAANPKFVDRTHDDYRLAGNPQGIGIDWRPSDQSYGPGT
jgi:Right handed beta helix region